MIVYWSHPIFQFESLPPDFAVFDLQALTKTWKPGHMTTDILRCPVAMQQLKNVYRLKSPIDYDLIWEGDRISSSALDQEFFSNNIILRDSSRGVISFTLARYMFFAEKPINMEFRNAFYAKNSFTNNASIMEGHYNIGNWFRPLDIGIIFNEQKKRVKIERGDTLAYVKFHTDEKIKFKKFYCNERIIHYYQGTVGSKKYNVVGKYSVLKKMNAFYNIFIKSHYKNIILKEIKSNLME